MQILEVANLDNWYDLNLEFNDSYHMESIGHGWTVKLVFENQMGKGYWLQKNDFQFDHGTSKLAATDNSETNFNSFLHAAANVFSKTEISSQRSDSCCCISCSEIW